MSQSSSRLPRQIGDAHIRLLRIYKAVIENGGFAAAEVELNISRPAISLAINELESLLEMKLCQRGRSGFSVTEQGEQVYQASLQLLSNLETFRAQINAINTELKGELNIGITDNMVTVPQMRITRALAKLKQRGPEVVINIRMIPPNKIESAVLEGRLHIGVVPDIRTLTGLNYTPLYNEQSLLYCSDEHPLYEEKDWRITPEQLAETDTVIPAYPQGIDARNQHAGLKTSASSTDREGIAFLILSGEYMGFLPTHFAARWVREKRMRSVQPQSRFFYTEFSAITRKGARPNLILDAYMEELQKLENT